MSLLDITAENIDVIAVMRNNGLNYETIKIFERKGTEFIYSSGGDSEHISIFNPDRPVKKSEIKLIIKKLFRENCGNIKIISSSTGVMHIYKKCT